MGGGHAMSVMRPAIIRYSPSCSHESEAGMNDNSAECHWQDGRGAGGRSSLPLPHFLSSQIRQSNPDPFNGSVVLSGKNCTNNIRQCLLSDPPFGFIFIPALNQLAD